MRKFSYIFILMFVLMLFMSKMAWAEDVVDTGDNAWILTCSALVLLMTPGWHSFMPGCLP
jgi:hypothetical protein